MFFLFVLKLMIVLGLMSGTSLDGLDLALVEFSNGGKTFNLISAETIKYSPKWYDTLSNVRKLSGNKLTELNVNYGKYLGAQINLFLKGKQQPKLISSHGHTVFHQPHLGYTLQIGSLNEIALLTNIKTVGDFRTLDISKGGQGAPLVPIGDEFLFPDYTYCVNLGGISNYSHKLNGKRIAQDISPCNIVSNFLAKDIGLDFDDNGDLGRIGKVQIQLLNEMSNWSYYKKGKSLGIEDLEKDFLSIINQSSYSVQDKLSTYYEHLGQIIGPFLKGIGTKSLFTGGGVKNSYLIERIKTYSESELIVPNIEIIDFKEAIIFALLGYLRINKEINILSSVTGASSDSSAGVIIQV